MAWKNSPRRTRLLTISHAPTTVSRSSEPSSSQVTQSSALSTLPTMTLRAPLFFPTFCFLSFHPREKNETSKKRGKYIQFNRIQLYELLLVLLLLTFVFLFFSKVRSAGYPTIYWDPTHADLLREPLPETVKKVRTFVLSAFCFENDNNRLSSSSYSLRLEESLEKRFCFFPEWWLPVSV